MTKADAIADIRAVSRVCRGPLASEQEAIKNALLEDGRLEEAAAEDAAGRPGCGFDVNDLICAEPFDRAPHAVACPSCGRTIRFTSPLYSLDA